MFKDLTTCGVKGLAEAIEVAYAQTTNFKGQFGSGDGLYCYPLTVTDNYSRYLLECQAPAGTLLQPSKIVFTRLLIPYGLPHPILTDNGVPFASHILGRTSRSSD